MICERGVGPEARSQVLACRNQEVIMSCMSESPSRYFHGHLRLQKHCPLVPESSAHTSCVTTIDENARITGNDHWSI